MYDKTVDELDDLSERLVGNAHVSGANGGHTLCLHEYAKDSEILLEKLIDLMILRYILIEIIQLIFFLLILGTTDYCKNFGIINY